MLWCNVGVTAEFSTKTYINCEPKFKDPVFEPIKKKIKYISFDPIKVYWEWNAKKQDFLKSSDQVKVWEYQYIFRINSRYEGLIYKWEELQIDRYTGAMKFSYWQRDTSTKEVYASTDRPFQCEKIEKIDLPIIKTKQQKF